MGQSKQKREQERRGEKESDAFQEQQNLGKQQDLG